MTKVRITKLNNRIVEVECDGHTGYGVYGEDIVCASLSSVVQTALLGLLAVAKIDVQLERDDEKGYLKFSVQKDLDGEELIKTNAILDTMMCGISDLVEGFSDFIDLEVR
ncbi:MAG: ribosomal-processing cysteine protease Prp [Clostridia bacterium]|nr:ribosomal-processing cysteine protease Prp [Clostridia bacterium]